MNLEEHLDDPDPISQTVLHPHHRHLLRVHKVDQADLAVQVVIEVIDQIDQIDQIAAIGRVEAEVHVLEKMNNVMIAELN
jgi:hypothetical protein